jgi:multidrug efflux pump subunit AcrB
MVQNISQIPGVAQVNVNGQQKPAVRIQLDPEKLASMGISLEDVRAVLTNITWRRSAGNRASSGGGASSSGRTVRPPDEDEMFH